MKNMDFGFSDRKCLFASKPSAITTFFGVLLVGSAFGALIAHGM